MTLNVPIPAGATTVYPWDETLSAEPLRIFDCASWRVDREWTVYRTPAPIEVELGGVQHHDGRVCYEILLDGDVLDVVAVRQLARALTAAVDEMDRLVGGQPRKVASHD